MITFAIAVVVLSALAAFLILQRASAIALRPETDPTVAVYRRQLTEIDDLADRGLLAESELRAAKTEAARRLLGAAKAHAPSAGGVSRAARLSVLAGAVAAPLLAAALYMILGSPGAPDQPFQARLGQWANADPRTLSAGQIAAVLETIVRKRPNDTEALTYLARAQADAGAVAAAAQTLRKAIRLEPKDGDLWANLGLLLLMQGQGEETGPATDAFRHAVALDPKNAAARYHLARARIATGDVQGGLADWRALAGDLPSEAAARGQLEAEITATAAAGRLAVPANPAGAPQQAAAGDRKALIKAMVARLEDRLRREPDDPAGWARLIRSYAVLGEADKMNGALAQAHKLFRDRKDALNLIDNAPSAPQGQQ